MTTTRPLTAAVSSLMAGPEYGLRVLAHISTASATVYLQTAIGNLLVNTITYAGIGHLGGVERIKDDLQRFSPGVKLWLSAASSTLLAAVLNEQLFNRDVLLYRAYFQNGAMVNTPHQWFKGRTNEVNLIRGDPERGDHVELTARIQIKKEPKSSYYTREDLWLTHSGDTGANYQSQIAGFKGSWGQHVTFFGTLTQGTAAHPGLGPARGGGGPIP